MDCLQRNLVLVFSISEINSSPSSSSLTFPQKNEFNPRSEIPTIVFATDPPESFFIGLISFKILSDTFWSTNVIAPFVKFALARKSSETEDTISKTAFPIPKIFLFIKFFPL